MNVRKPTKSLKGWVVLISETASPLSPVIERIECSSREQAWQIYRQIKIEQGKMI